MKKLLIVALVLFAFNTSHSKIDKKLITSINTANDIIKHIDKSEDYKSSYSKVAMVIYPNSNDSKNIRIIKMIGYSMGRDNSFYRYVYPNGVKGMKMLSRGDDVWMYFPSTGRKRKIASYNKKKSVEGVGGDFSYQDMTMGDYAKDYKARVTYNRANTWTLELIPRLEGHAYTKIEMLVEKGSYRINQIKYYDSAGLLKALFLTNYKKIKSYDIPVGMTMVNYRKGSKTVLKTISMKLDINIDRKYFDANRLESN